MKTFILITILFLTLAVTAQVGIGTNTPDSNAVLDLTSSDRGLLLPRLNDTSNVATPAAGLMIYDVNAKSPAFHNGTSWNTVAINNVIASVANNDSITYSISGPGSAEFTTGSFNVSSLSAGASNPGPPSATSWSDVNFTKPSDSNSVSFLKAVATSDLVAMIEFNVYESGSATPYFSIKLSNWRTASAQFSLSQGGKFESISLSFGTIGFYDWINNNGFSYNTSTMAIGPY